MDVRALALAVDEQVYRPPSDCEISMRCYAVMLPEGSEIPELRLLEKGEGRRILRRLRLPRGLTALAVTAAGWRAPMEGDGSMEERPSRHPDRKRIHSTTVVAGDGELVTVLRTADVDPNGRVEVLPGGEGAVPELIQQAWMRARVREDGRADVDGEPWAVGDPTCRE